MFSLGAFNTKNDGDLATGQTSARMYFDQFIGKSAGSSGDWQQQTASDEIGFPVEYWCCGFLGNRIVNPGETWNWPEFWGSWPRELPVGKPVTVKIKFFYGKKKPAVASFTIRKKGSPD